MNAPPAAQGSSPLETTARRLDATAVAKLLIEIGQRLVLAGDNPYKARSYARAAESLLLLTEPLDEVIAEGRLQEIAGVGVARGDHSSAAPGWHHSSSGGDAGRARRHFDEARLPLTKNAELKRSDSLVDWCRDGVGGSP